MGRTAAVISLLGLTRHAGTGVERLNWAHRPGLYDRQAATNQGREEGRIRVGQHRDGDRLRRRIRIPGLARRTVRLRLTALYGVLFLVSGAALLAIAGGGFAVIRSSTEASGSSSTVPAPQSAAAKLASANALIRQLRDQLSAQAGTTQAVFSRDLLIASAIALGIMTLGSVAMGWILAGRAL